MDKGLVAEASITVDAPVERVWQALVDPAAIKEYMFGTDAVSDWREGSQIVWKGEWQGRTYEDKGQILRLDPPRVMQYSHFSPLTGQPDAPENYHTVTIDLASEGDQTVISLRQDNNASEEEREHSQNNWSMMLESLKQLLEKR